MGSEEEISFLQRASIDGALCTIRCVIGDGQIPNVKGEWLGVEWDDPTRGKHDGTYQGRRYFTCLSSQPSVASFIRPTRKLDQQRTVLQAIKFKYGGESDDASSSPDDVVIISGKVAEEVGFDKIAKEQSVLEDLKIVVLEKLVVNGISSRGSSPDERRTAQAELARTCPNIIELDLSYNTIDSWATICDICAALPKLQKLTLNGLRFHLTSQDLASCRSDTFPSMKEIQFNECLLKPYEILGSMLKTASEPRFPKLRKLWMSQNELAEFNVSSDIARQYESIQEFIFENNFLQSLESTHDMLSIFPNLRHLSLQRNRIESISTSPSIHQPEASTNTYDGLESISVSHNQIKGFEFVDALSIMLPNLHALRISENPLYQVSQSTTLGAAPSETNYYLTLARLPALKTLNYSQITSREREEGEIYYLSVAERDIRTILSTTDISKNDAREQVVKGALSKYLRYQALCQKYDRESLLDKIASPPSQDAIASILEETASQKHPPGSIAANLVRATFYLANKQGTSSSSATTANSPDIQVRKEHQQEIPITIPTNQIFSLVARTFNLTPLQFKLIYESEELDPLQEDITTRSQLYDNNNNITSTSTSTSTSASVSKPEQVDSARYQRWGDWDVDDIPLKETQSKGDNDNDNDNDNEARNTELQDGKWSEDGYWIKDGRRWKRREVHILNGLRNWGDWLDKDVKNASIRIQLVD